MHESGLPDRPSLERAAHLLRDARRVLFITGAGMSADSGLPTYRGIGGLYQDALTADGLPVEVALSGEMLRRDPAVCWRYIQQIEEACRGAGPNRGHAVLAEVERDRDHVCVLTQNVDGLHRAAGSQNVLEIHGDIHALQCTRCPHRCHVDSYADLPALPRCGSCDAVLRPAVVLFGELLPEACCRALDREWDEGFDLVLSIGTTSTFPYIARPVVMARAQGIPSIEINPDRSEVTELVEVRLRGRAAPTLDALWRAAHGDTGP